MSEAVVWFRRDLRLTDNPAWGAACSRHRRVTALFVIDPGLWDRVTVVRRDFLAARLRRLDDALVHLGGRLRVEWGDPVAVAPRVAGRRPVYANADVSDYARRRDRAVEKRARLHWRHGSLVHPPGSVLTRQGRIYTVFTPFHRAWDGDTSQNVGNWQWVTGCGADAAPYFRIFNPVTQSRRFDPDGVYIRRWVPELRNMVAPGIHAPWQVGTAARASAGLVLNGTYPSPIVDHAGTRKRALAAYKTALSG